MAHNLATINGAVAMAYQGSTPWHNLGTRVNSITSVAQALEAANLSNWHLKLEADVSRRRLSEGRRRATRRARDRQRK
jgi:hypothetical protein